MNRWIRIVLAASALLAALAFAQNQGIRREAPKDVVLGHLVVTAPPQVTVDGKADRLSPGSRIRDLNNMLVLSGAIVGKKLPVVYRRDAAGLVHEVWILTEAEYGKLGGTSDDAEGRKRFAELLGTVFGARK